MLRIAVFLGLKLAELIGGGLIYLVCCCVGWRVMRWTGQPAENRADRWAFAFVMGGFALMLLVIVPIAVAWWLWANWQWATQLVGE